MLMKMRSKMQNEKGFTLVELMVVVVILGILVAIAVPVYKNVTDNANRKAVEANLRTIDGAIMQYQAVNNGTSPTATTQIAPDYMQVWPSGPDKVVYSINAGRAVATATSGTDGTGTWFNATATADGTGYRLPITWAN